MYINIIWLWYSFLHCTKTSIVHQCKQSWIRHRETGTARHREKEIIENGGAGEEWTQAEISKIYSRRWSFFIWFCWFEWLSSTSWLLLLMIPTKKKYPNSHKIQIPVFRLFAWLILCSSIFVALSLLLFIPHFEWSYFRSVETMMTWFDKPTNKKQESSCRNRASLAL